ncbi:MAG: 3-phosphoshikimate 1-carboxyvinyltransferase [Actinomycetota bacterium]
MTLTVQAADGLKGELNLPGDKSISHRAVILGAVADGDTTVKNFLNTGDCLSTVRCLTDLGVAVDGVGGQVVTIRGRGLTSLSEPRDVLDAGNSATTARLLTGLLSGQDFFSCLSGDDSLRERPMGRVTEPLGAMGAHISGREGGQKLPLAIKGGPLEAIEYKTPVASAQIKSALLLAGLYADGVTTVIEPHPSRDHTERLMEVMGAAVKTGENTVSITGGRALKGVTVEVPADMSSAAFFIVAALITRNSSFKLKQVGTNTTRIGLLDTLKNMGAVITYDAMSMKQREPRADIIIESSQLIGTRVGPELVPRLIDELPVLAVAATQAEGETVIKGAAELRVKETDRISAIVENLKKMGADIVATKDGMVIKGPVKLKGAVVDSYGDHRIAMAMAVAGLVAAGKTVIEDDACIDISFPGFEKVLNSVLS